MMKLFELRDSMIHSIILHIVGIIVSSIVLDHVLQNFQYLDLIDYSMILSLTHIF